MNTTSFRRKPIRWERHFGLIFVLPTVVLLIVFVLGPLLYSVWMSLSNVVIGQTSLSLNFVGLRNFEKLLADDVFRLVLRQSAVYSVLQVAGVIVCGLGIAVLLNNSGSAGILRYAFLLPWALSYVINGVIWGWIFNGSFGVLNYLLLRLGIISHYHVWLAEPEWALLGVIAANVWKAVPFVALMILAALQNVPRELTEAARVDGANRLQTFRRITLPCIKPTLLVLIVIETMWSLKSFDLIWVLTQGGPVNRTMLLSVFSYQESFRFFKFGTGSASALVMAAIILVLTLGYMKLLRSKGEE